MNLRQKVKRRARKLKRRISAIAVALRDPATPWYAKALGAAVIAYAVSPFDLIPDFIPVLGLVDDAVLVPLGIYATLRLIPRAVFLKALRSISKKQVRVRLGWAGAALIIAFWLAAAFVIAKLVFHW